MDTKELLGRVCGSVSDNEICIYDCGDGTYMRLIKNASESDFLKICGECERLGYTLFQRNDIEENIHASYRGNMLIHTYFCPAEKILRVLRLNKIIYSVAYAGYKAYRPVQAEI